jgi:hypothetical protein
MEDLSQLNLHRVRRAIADRQPTAHLLKRLNCASPGIVDTLLFDSMRDLNLPLHEETLEWFRLRGCESQIVDIAIFQGQSCRVYEWLATKKPDVFSWDYCGVWKAVGDAAVQGAKNCPGYLWLLDRVGPDGVASLAAREIGCNIAYCGGAPCIMFLLALGSYPALEEAILRRVIADRNWRLLRPFMKKPGAIRAVCLADGGRVLHAKPPGPKCLLRFLSPSDRASVGLQA